MSDNKLYETPLVEWLTYCSEGVLCQSLPGSGEGWMDGGEL